MHNLRSSEVLRVCKSCYFVRTSRRSLLGQLGVLSGGGYRERPIGRLKDRESKHKGELRPIGGIGGEDSQEPPMGQ
jgi:hypothetical protein